MEVNIKGISFAYWNNLKPAIEGRLRNLDVRITLSPDGTGEPLRITPPTLLEVPVKLEIATVIAEVCSKHSGYNGWYRGFYINNLLA